MPTISPVPLCSNGAPLWPQYVRLVWVAPSADDRYRPADSRGGERVAPEGALADVQHVVVLIDARP